MKSKTAIQLNKDWWKREQPKGIERKSGAAFLSAIAAFADSSGKLAKAVKAGNSDAAVQLSQEAADRIDALEDAGKAVAAEVKRLLRPAPADAKVRLDLENTLAVMGKPLARELDSLRGGLDAMDAGPAEEDISGAEAYTAYLRKWMPKLKKGAYSFALVMPGKQAEDIRISVHRTKDGKALAGALRKSVGGGKFTWGIAAAERQRDDVEDDSAKTLILALDGKRIPGLAKKVKIMFRELGVPVFRKVKILVDGVEVEHDGTPEEDLPEAGDAPELAELPDTGGDAAPGRAR